MTVTLPADLVARIRETVERGRYDDETAVIRDAMDALEAREEERFLHLRELIRVGLESGNGRELTPELWAEIDREVDEAYERGDTPDPNVCP